MLQGGGASLVEVLTLRGGYNTNLVLAGASLLGLAAGVVGVFALLRKRSLVTDALSHATLPGIVLAFLAAGLVGAPSRSLPLLLAGAAASAVLGVLSIQALLRHTRLTEDAAIGVVLSVFFGAGVVGLSYVQANAAAGSAGLNGFVYGQAATLQPGDLALMAAIAAVALVIAIAALKELALVAFDESFAASLGLSTSAIDLVTMGLIVLVTVAGLQAVGVIMVVALLIIPPVAARFWTERLPVLVALAGAFGAASGFLGAVASAVLPDKPAGAVIVLTAGALFAISMLVAPARGVIASISRRVALRLRIESDHLLDAGHEAAGGRLAPEDVVALGDLRGWSRTFRAALLGRLQRRGLVARGRDGALAVTAPGLARGARVRRNHALWEQFLISHADVAPARVDWSVDQVEHVLTDEMVAALEGKLRARGIEPDAPATVREGEQP